MAEDWLRRHALGAALDKTAATHHSMSMSSKGDPMAIYYTFKESDADELATKTWLAFAQGSPLKLSEHPGQVCRLFLDCDCNEDPKKPCTLASVSHFMRSFEAFLRERYRPDENIIALQQEGAEPSPFRWDCGGDSNKFYTTCFCLRSELTTEYEGERLAKYHFVWPFIVLDRSVMEGLFRDFFAQWSVYGLLAPDYLPFQNGKLRGLWCANPQGLRPYTVRSIFVDGEESVHQMEPIAEYPFTKMWGATSLLFGRWNEEIQGRALREHRDQVRQHRQPDPQVQRQIRQQFAEEHGSVLARQKAASEAVESSVAELVRAAQAKYDMARGALMAHVGKQRQLKQRYEELVSSGADQEAVQEALGLYNAVRDQRVKVGSDFAAASEGLEATKRTSAAILKQSVDAAVAPQPVRVVPVVRSEAGNIPRAPAEMSDIERQLEDLRARWPKMRECFRPEELYGLMSEVVSRCETTPGMTKAMLFDEVEQAIVPYINNFMAHVTDMVKPTYVIRTWDAKIKDFSLTFKTADGAKAYLQKGGIMPFQLQGPRGGLGDKGTLVAFDVWSRSRSSLFFTKPYFGPVEELPYQALMTYTGIGVSPEQAATARGKFIRGSRTGKIIDVNTLVDVLHMSVCGGDSRAFSYVMKWMAAAVRDPFKKLNTVLVFQSPEGVGKDLFMTVIMGAILGLKNCVVTTAKDDVMGKFNASMENKVYCVFNEAGGVNEREADAMKSLITDGNLRIEHKGVDTYFVQNYMNYVVLTNHTDIFTLSAQARRYVIIDGSDMLLGQRAFWADIADFIGADAKTCSNGDMIGIKAFADYLYTKVDIDTWDPRDFPVTRALIECKLNSMGALSHWWYECLRFSKFCGSGDAYDTDERGHCIPRWTWTDQGVEVPVENLLLWFRRWCSKAKKDCDAQQLCTFCAKFKKLAKPQDRRCDASVIANQFKLLGAVGSPLDADGLAMQPPARKRSRMGLGPMDDVVMSQCSQSGDPSRAVAKQSTHTIYRLPVIEQCREIFCQTYTGFTFEEDYKSAAESPAPVNQIASNFTSAIGAVNRVISSVFDLQVYIPGAETDEELAIRRERQEKLQQAADEIAKACAVVSGLIDIIPRTDPLANLAGATAVVDSLNWAPAPDLSRAPDADGSQPKQDESLKWLNDAGAYADALAEERRQFVVSRPPTPPAAAAADYASMDCGDSDSDGEDTQPF